MRQAAFEAVDTVGNVDISGASEVRIPLDTVAHADPNSYVSLVGGKLTMADNAPVGTYRVTIRASAGVESGAGANGVRVYPKVNDVEVTEADGYCSIGA